MQEHEDIAIFAVKLPRKQYIEIVNRSPRKYEVMDIKCIGYGRLPTCTVMPYENCISRIIPNGHVEVLVRRESAQPLHMDVRSIDINKNDFSLEIKLASAGMIAKELSWVPFTFLENGWMIISGPPAPESFIEERTDDMGQTILTKQELSFNVPSAPVSFQTNKDALSPVAATIPSSPVELQFTEPKKSSLEGQRPAVSATSTYGGLTKRHSEDLSAATANLQIPEKARALVTSPETGSSMPVAEAEISEIPRAPGPIPPLGIASRETDSRKREREPFESPNPTSRRQAPWTGEVPQHLCVDMRRPDYKLEYVGKAVGTKGGAAMVVEPTTDQEHATDDFMKE